MFCWSPHVWLNSSPCFCGSTTVVQIFVFSLTTPSDVAPLKFHPFCCSNPKIHLKSSETPTCCHETPLFHTSSPFLNQFPSIFLIPFSPNGNVPPRHIHPIPSPGCHILSHDPIISGSSVGMMNFPISEKMKFWFESTNQYIYIHTL